MEPTDYYNYKKNISVVTTPNGDKVVTMNSQIFNSLVNNLYEAAEYQEKEMRRATSDETKKLWRTLIAKEEEGM